MTSQGQRFRRRAVRRGYKVDEVDSFLDRVEATLGGDPSVAPVTAQEVHDVVFRVRFGGYDEWQVDLHLDRVERQLADLEERGGIFARGPESRLGQAMRDERFAPPMRDERPGPMRDDRMSPFNQPSMPNRPLAPAGMNGAPMGNPMNGQLSPVSGPPMAYPMSGPPMSRPMSGPPMSQPPLPMRPVSGPPPMSQPPRPVSGPPMAGGPVSGGYMSVPPMSAPPMSPPPMSPPPMSQRPMSGPPMSTPPPMSPPPAGSGPAGYPRFEDTDYTLGGFGEDFGGRRGRMDMTTEMRRPMENTGGIPIPVSPADMPGNGMNGHGGYGGAMPGNGMNGNGMNGMNGNGMNGNAMNGGAMNGNGSPELQRIDAMRRTFTTRRFGSGYDASQVNRLFDAIIDSLSGHGMPLNESELDPNQFSLVPGGYFEAEVNNALREVRDLVVRR